MPATAAREAQASAQKTLFLTPNQAGLSGRFLRRAPWKATGAGSRPRPPGTWGSPEILGEIGEQSRRWRLCSRVCLCLPFPSTTNGSIKPSSPKCSRHPPGPLVLPGALAPIHGLLPFPVITHKHPDRRRAGFSSVPDLWFCRERACSAPTRGLGWGRKALADARPPADSRAQPRTRDPTCRTCRDGGHTEWER